MAFPDGLKRAAAMVILRAGNEYLLLKRNKMPNAGMYVPVGGKVDPYEDPYQTAIREVGEETGIQLAALQYAGSLVETSPVNYNWWCSIYVADIPWQEAPYCDEGTLAWISHDQLPSIPTPPTDEAIYEYILSGTPFALRAIYNDQLQLLEMTEEISGKRLV